MSCSRMVPFFAGFSETCFVAVLPPLVIVGALSSLVRLGRSGGCQLRAGEVGEIDCGEVVKHII